MQINKYLKYIIIALFLIVFIFIANRFSNKNSNEIISDDENKIVEITSFNDAMSSFEAYYKKALVFSERLDQKHALENSTKLLNIWKEVYKNHKDNQDKEYGNTVTWAKDLELIYESSIRSNKLIKDERLLEGRKELEKIRIIIRNMRRENNINNINDQLLDFEEKIIPVASAKSKEETLKYIKDLKLDFLALKELNINNDYNKKMGEIEKAISGIDSLLASDFRQSQKDLLKSFEDLYISVK